MNETEQSLALQRLESHRDRLKRIDEQILRILVRRDSVSMEVAEVKKTLERPSLDELQEEVMIKARRNMADALGLDPDYAEGVFRAVHDHSVEVQEAYRQA